MTQQEFYRKYTSKSQVQDRVASQGSFPQNMNQRSHHNSINEHVHRNPVSGYQGTYQSTNQYDLNQTGPHNMNQSMTPLDGDGTSANKQYSHTQNNANDYFSPSFQLKPSSQPLVRKAGLFQYKVYKQATPSTKSNDDWNRIIQPIVHRKGMNISRIGDEGRPEIVSYMQKWEEKRPSKRSFEYGNYTGRHSKRKREDNERSWPKRVKRPSYKSVLSGLKNSVRHSRFIDQLKEYVATKFGRDTILRRQDEEFDEHEDILDQLFDSWNFIQEKHFVFESDSYPKSFKRHPENVINLSRKCIMEDQLKVIDNRIEALLQLEKMFDEAEKNVHGVKENILDVESSASQDPFEEEKEIEPTSQNTISQELTQSPGKTILNEIIPAVNTVSSLFNVKTRLKEVEQLSIMLEEVLNGEIGTFHFECVQAEQLNRNTIQALLPSINHDESNTTALTTFLDKSMTDDYSKMYPEHEENTIAEGKRRKMRQSSQNPDENLPTESRAQAASNPSNTLEQSRTKKKRRHSRTSIASNQEADVLNQEPDRALEDFLQ